MFDDNDSLSEKRFKLTMWMLTELVKMRNRDIQSGLLKKVNIFGKEQYLINEAVITSKILLPFNHLEAILINVLSKKHLGKTKLDVLYRLYGENNLLNSIYTTNDYKKYINFYVPKAKRITIKMVGCRWQTKESIFAFRKIYKYTIFYNSSRKLNYVLISKGSGLNRKVEKVTFTYNNQGQPIVIFTHEYQTQELISSLHLYYDRKDRIIKEELTNYHSGSKFDYIETTEYVHEYKENYHKVTYYQEPKFSYLDENGEELEEEMVKYSIEEKFDYKGNLIEHKFYSEEEGLIELEKYFYSKEGDLVSSYYLNEDGNVLLESHYSKNLRTTIDRKKSNAVTIDKTQIEYNNKGHWIKECTVSNDDLKWIEEREIKYYD